MYKTHMCVWQSVVVFLVCKYVPYLCVHTGTPRFRCGAGPGFADHPDQFAGMGIRLWGCREGSVWEVAIWFQLSCGDRVDLTLTFGPKRQCSSSFPTSIFQAIAITKNVHFNCSNSSFWNFPLQFKIYFGFCPKVQFLSDGFHFSPDENPATFQVRNRHMAG